MTVLIGILAAGASTRMRGSDKLMEDVEGEPLLVRQMRIAKAAAPQVVVALPERDERRLELVAPWGVRAVPVRDPERGMSASIAALAQQAQAERTAALLLFLADMPEIEVGDLASLIAEAERHPSAIVRAGTPDGRPGHPVIFPRRWFPDLARLTGDRGARDLIEQAEDVRIVPLPGERALTDLDTPEAWAAWRSARPSR